MVQREKFASMKDVTITSSKEECALVTVLNVQKVRLALMKDVPTSPCREECARYMVQSKKFAATKDAPE